MSRRRSIGSRAARARYEGRTQVVTSTHPDTPDAPGLTKHYVRTRHGWVARTWIGDGMTEVVLLRPGNTGATYQGTVRAVPGPQRPDASIRWIAEAPDRRAVAAAGNYLDAEAALLLHRWGIRSAVTHLWPLAAYTEGKRS